MRPPRPACWPRSTMRPMLVGRCGPPAGCWSLARPGRGGGWPRQAAERLDDRAPGGHPVHGLLDWKVVEILALFHQWGETDRSHRKLAHRGSYLERVWVSPPAYGGCCWPRVCGCARCPGRAQRPPAVPGLGRIPARDAVDLRHDPLCQGEDSGDGDRGPGLAQVAAEVVSSEEMSIQAQAALCQALEAEGLMEQSPPGWTARSTLGSTIPCGRSCWR
jgi:putative transposase